MKNTNNTSSEGLTFTEWMAKIKNVHFADREAMDRAIASLTKPYREDA